MNLYTRFISSVILCVAIIQNSAAQDSQDMFVNSLCNKDLKYDVYKVGRTTLGDNNSITLPTIEARIFSLDLEYVFQNADKKQLAKRLYSILKEDSRHWYANVILYALFKRDATPLIIIKNREDWIKKFKKQDLEYWGNLVQ